MVVDVLLHILDHIIGKGPGERERLPSHTEDTTTESLLNSVLNLQHGFMFIPAYPLPHLIADVIVALLKHC